MLLSQLLPWLAPQRISGPISRSVDRITHDSRNAGSQDIFVAICGQTLDGRRFVPDLDVAAVIADRPVEARPGTTVIYVEDARAALSAGAAALSGFPSEKMFMIGLTGTNGKTTTSWLIERLAISLGKKIGVVGTLGNRIQGEPAILQGGFTTPEAALLQPLLAEMHASGCQLVAMEVSSIGLALHRTRHIRFDVAAFTNFTRDHLDFHGDMQSYLDAKRLLFKQLKGEKSISLLNSEVAECMDTETEESRRWTFGRGGDLEAHAVSETLEGIEADLTLFGEQHHLSMPLVGRHNLSNAIAALACIHAAGMPLDKAIRALANIDQIPGRLERVDKGGGAAVFVDYAHTPDALGKALGTLRALCKGRVICVFGCGGDRDPGKRPEMGRIASSLSDLAIVTSDNPRTEDPLEIIAEVRKGMSGTPMENPDRREAIRYALRSARNGDAVLIAGKGHETYQIIGTERKPFDDREEARNAMEGAA
jgi:UDP-N-acetylmuramoyl-L-alanyl-D-glutamate--2,6-diaminopimelate ligase